MAGDVTPGHVQQARFQVTAAAGGGFSSFEAEETPIGRRMQSERGTAPTVPGVAEPAVGGLARAVSERPAAKPLEHMEDDVEDVAPGGQTDGRHLQVPVEVGAAAEGRPRQRTEPGLVPLAPPVDAPTGLAQATSEGSRRPHTMAAMEEGEDDL